MIEQLKKQISKEGISFRSVTAMLIFGAIVVVFVLFGFQGKHTATGNGAAAVVNDTLISVADLRSEASRLEQMYAQFFGGKADGDMQRQFVQQQALESLITGEVVSQAAQRNGILTTDAEVRDYIIHEMPVFQKDGKFQRDVYQQILTANRLTPADFEQKVRKDLVSRRSRQLLELTATPSALELEKLKALKETKINVGFAKIDKEKVLAQMSIPESEVQAKLADSEFKKKVESEFNANKASYSNEEEVRAQHILIKVDPTKPESEKQALDKIKSLQKRAEKEDFGKIASEVSEDIGSKAKKGDLGFFARGRMVPEFEKVAFEQKVGVVGGPVKSQFGYHLIKVLEKKPAQEAKLELAQNQIAKKLMASEKFEAEMKIFDEAVTQGKTEVVDSKLKMFGVEWDETGYFDLSAESVPKMNSAVALQAAFEVSEAKPFLGKVIRDGGSRFILKFKGMKKEPLVADEKSLVAQMTREKSMDIYGQWIEQEKKTTKIERNLELLNGR